MNNATESLNPPANPQRRGLFAEWSEMIKLEHTVFALPFALSGLLLASTGWPSLETVFWTIAAFAGARAASMTLNRLIDAKIDARNPRTKDRSIPAGRISVKQAVLFSVGSFAIMAIAATRLPVLCVQLLPVAVIWLSVYSFTKRFTWLCHIILGIAIGGAALGGWVAAGGTLQAPAAWVLMLAVATWVGSFDIIYACQDVDIDRKEKLHSMPAKFGVAAALNISSALHVVTVLSLVGVGLICQLGAFYWLGFTIVVGMLIYEHSIVKPNDLSRVNAAFFTVNGVVSILMFLAILLDKLF
ncbi:MAG TPA: UbiA-like polyprenyltransferase [Drouetiella sp.]|jgi:4-hydroxybenzoate polyprenyltransferase